MRYLKQFGIILAISFIGEILHFLIPLPIPASIYGIFIMLLCLSLHIFPVEAVRDTSMFLIEIMPVMFIPAAVGLINSWSILQGNLIEYLIITVVSTIAVMASAGRVTQAVRRRQMNDSAAKGEQTPLTPTEEEHKA